MLGDQTELKIDCTSVKRGRKFGLLVQLTGRERVVLIAIAIVASAVVLTIFLLQT